MSAVDLVFFFFFQAEDGIRDFHVTGVQTCALPISRRPALDLTLQEEADTSGGKPRSQHLLIGPPDKKGQSLVRDLAWTPIATAASGILGRINGTIDAIVKEAAAPKPAASPAASPSVSPSPPPA